MKFSKLVYFRFVAETFLRRLFFSEISDFRENIFQTSLFWTLRMYSRRTNRELFLYECCFIKLQFTVYIKAIKIYIKNCRVSAKY
jgi:hypothetical protein